MQPITNYGEGIEQLNAYFAQRMSTESDPIRKNVIEGLQRDLSWAFEAEGVRAFRTELGHTHLDYVWCAQGDGAYAAINEYSRALDNFATIFPQVHAESAEDDKQYGEWRRICDALSA